MTQVIPIATIPTNEKFVVILAIFWRFRNWGIKIARTSNIKMRAPRIPISRGRRTVRRREAFSGWGGATASEFISNSRIESQRYGGFFTGFKQIPAEKACNQLLTDVLSSIQAFR
jgi:hypothetical protein